LLVKFHAEVFNWIQLSSSGNLNIWMKIRRTPLTEENNCSSIHADADLPKEFSRQTAKQIVWVLKMMKKIHFILDSEASTQQVCSQLHVSEVQTELLVTNRQSRFRIFAPYWVLNNNLVKVRLLKIDEKIERKGIMQEKFILSSFSLSFKCSHQV
jgi:hypothetical protein